MARLSIIQLNVLYEQCNIAYNQRQPKLCAVNNKIEFGSIQPWSGWVPATKCNLIFELCVDSWQKKGEKTGHRDIIFRMLLFQSSINFRGFCSYRFVWLNSIHFGYWKFHVKTDHAIHEADEATLMPFYIFSLPFLYFPQNW